MVDRIELSIAPDYVSWSLWEALREIQQNAKDRHDLGYQMSVKYHGPTSSITISNHDSKLSRSSLVLGHTEKKNDSKQRGQFGEGYKLACATLLRLGHKVVIVNQDEEWVPQLEYSETFKTTVLVIYVSRLRKVVNDLSFYINNVGQKDYRFMVDRLLFMQQIDQEKVSETPYGNVLLSGTHSNSLFVKDIFVCNMHDTCRFGYNLLDVSLDRDRRLADPQSLKKSIAQSFALSVVQGKISVLNAFETLSLRQKLFVRCDPWGEAHALLDYPDQGKFNKLILDQFVEIHGEKSIPVSSRAEALEAEHYGLVGVETSAAIVEVIACIQDSLSRVRDQKAMAPKKTYTYADLSKLEKSNFDWATKLINSATDITKYHVEVVDFYGRDINGTYAGPSSGWSLPGLVKSIKPSQTHHA